LINPYGSFGHQPRGTAISRADTTMTANQEEKPLMKLPAICH